MKQILVSNCGDCPYEYDGYCAHPEKARDGEVDDREMITSDCPLPDAPDRPAIEEVEDNLK